MQIVHAMLNNIARIDRKVTHLPDGIRTVTESDDPQVSRWIKEHVAAMTHMVPQGRVYAVDIGTAMVKHLAERAKQRAPSI